MAEWLNRAVYQLPRNGTTSHTINPSSATDLVLGAAFTPTAGRLLVTVAGGAVTSSTPSGWTLPAGGSAINGTGLYVWYRTAVAGSNVFTTTHNGGNYPVIVAVYEFPAGSTFVKSVSGFGIAWNGANPNLTGLTGANLVMAMKQRATTAASPADFTWTPPTVKDWMYYVYKGSSTDGYETTLGYAEDYTGSSWQPTATHSEENPNTFEALTFAVNVAADDPSVERAATGVLTVAGASPRSNRISRAASGVTLLAGSTAHTLAIHRSAVGTLEPFGVALPTVSIERTATEMLGVAGLASLADLPVARSAIGTLALLGTAHTGSRPSPFPDKLTLTGSSPEYRLTGNILTLTLEAK